MSNWGYTLLYQSCDNSHAHAICRGEMNEAGLHGAASCLELRILRLSKLIVEVELLMQRADLERLDVA